MTPTDLLKFNPCNLDHLTETYNIGFYLEYFTKWPQLCKVIEGANGQIEAYSNRALHSSTPSSPPTDTSTQSSAKSKRHPTAHQWNPTTQA